ncbi:hypothetical protein [Halorubrum luteum]
MTKTPRVTTGRRSSRRWTTPARPLSTSSDAARGPDAARRLWTYSTDVLGIDESLRDVAGEGG